jgi:hypothetical protein
MVDVDGEPGEHFGSEEAHAPARVHAHVDHSEVKIPAVQLPVDPSLPT